MSMNHQSADVSTTDIAVHVAAQGDGLGLKVIIHPYGCWEFEGTRAQLEAEGAIPSGTKWPIGSASCMWTSGRFRYRLCRTRPEGLKGPMRLWVNGDWWSFRCSYDDGLDYAKRAILQKKRELEAEIRRHSAWAERERNALWDRYWKAKQDGAFQAFRALVVPERKKPGRKPGAKVQGGGHV